MPWGRLDDGLYDHPKLDALGKDRLPALGLWVSAVSWCNRRLTDGAVPAERIALLGGSKALADRLVSVGLFDADGDGYRVHDFLEFNDSREDIMARRDADAERKRLARGGNVRGGVPPESERSPSGQTPDVRPDSKRTSRAPARSPASRPDPTLPTPDLSTPQPPASGGRRSNGTNPRSVAAEAEALATLERGAKRWRRAQRQQAYLRGVITSDQQAQWDRDDAPLERIPDWAEQQARIAADVEAAL